MSNRTRSQTKKLAAANNSSNSVPVPQTSLNFNQISPINPPHSPAIMTGNTGDLTAQLGISLEGLPNDHKTLALAIIQGIASYMDQKMAEERSNYQNTIEALQHQLTLYQEKLDDLECYGRRNTIVISGSSVPLYQSDESCIDIAKNIITSKLEVPIEPEDFCVAHRLGTPKPGQPDRRNIIAKLVRRTKKHEIYRACGVKKPTDIYFSDSVSKTRHTILYALRMARKRDSSKFGIARTRDGNIRLQLPSLEDPRRSTTEVVNTRRKLEELLLTRLNINSSAFDCHW